MAIIDMTATTRSPVISVDDVHAIRASVDMKPVDDQEAQRIADQVNTRAAAAQMAPATLEGRLAAEQLSHAAVVDDYRVGKYTPIGPYTRCHSHGVHNIVGYVVRETVGADGEGILRRDDGGVGYDVAVIGDPNRYENALEITREYHDRGRYAVVDVLYLCGCRS